MIELYLYYMKRPLREIGIENIRRYRLKKGITQLELATELGKSANYINGIENGASFPSIDMIDRIAEILGIAPYEIFIEQSSPIKTLKENPEKYSEEIANSIYKRIKNDIAYEVKEAIIKAN